MSPLHQPVVQFFQIATLVAFAVTAFSAYCIPSKWLRPWMLMAPGGAFIGSLGLYAVAFVCACAK